jgi:hypothetical protein
MKSFQQFQEDLNQLQKDLSILDKKRLQKQRLIARRKSAQDRSKSAGDEFNQRSANEVESQKERTQ